MPPLGHISVDVSNLARAYGYARAPGGGPETSGLNPAVRAQIASNPEYGTLLNSTVDCILQLAREGVEDIKVAVGCKWGKHRSVSFVVDLSDHELIQQCFATIQVLHLEQHNWDMSVRPVGDLAWYETTVRSLGGD